jgi:GNAT superfamily N-acetyltransferase
MVDVVPVAEELLTDLTRLWLASRIEAGLCVDTASGSSQARLLAALRRPDVHAYLARVDGQPVGYVISSENVFGLSTAPELAIEQLYVESRVRNRGVAKALLGAVVGHAERAGCDVIVGNVPSQSRDANRFFARLGFSSILVRRMTSTGLLRRRLGGDQVSAGLEQILRRRRSLRHRAVQTPTRSA